MTRIEGEMSVFNLTEFCSMAGNHYNLSFTFQVIYFVLFSATGILILASNFVVNICRVKSHKFLQETKCFPSFIISD